MDRGTGRRGFIRSGLAAAAGLAVGGGGRPVQAALREGTALAREKEFRFCVEAMGDAAAHAGRRGVELAPENRGRPAHDPQAPGAGGVSGTLG